jgi:hypothetical protein
MAFFMTISDAGGTREHSWADDALKVEFIPKIGTVVITDLKVADVPRSMPQSAEMAMPGHTLIAEPWGWEVTNADGESYSDSLSVFYMSLKGKKVIVHAS